MAVLLPSSIESALAAWRWRAARRVGYATDGRAALLTDALPLPAPRRHQVDEYAALLAPLGVTDVAAAPAWTLRRDDAMDAEIARLLAEAGVAADARLVGLHLGAAFGSSKLWPAEAFGRLAQRLAAAGLTPVLLGTGDDADTAAAVIRAAGGPIASLVGRDRPALLPRLLARLRCLVSGDTGVAHLAAAVDVATVTLFGPTDRRLTAPRGRRQPDPRPRGAVRAVLSPALSHRPCLPHPDRAGRGAARGQAGRGVKTVLHTEASPGLGGQEVRTLNEARWTVERGWRVLVAGQPDGRLLERARAAGLETAPVRMAGPLGSRARSSAWCG